MPFIFFNGIGKIEILLLACCILLLDTKPFPVCSVVIFLVTLHSSLVLHISYEIHIGFYRYGFSCSGRHRHLSAGVAYNSFSASVGSSLPEKFKKIVQLAFVAQASGAIHKEFL